MIDANARYRAAARRLRNTYIICDSFIYILDFKLSPYSECMNMKQTKCYEMLAYKIQTPRKYPEENIQLLFT